MDKIPTTTVKHSIDETIPAARALEAQEQLDRIEDTQKSILEGQVEILQAIGQLLKDNERDESLEMQHQRFKREAGE